MTSRIVRPTTAANKQALSQTRSLNSCSTSADVNADFAPVDGAATTAAAARARGARAGGDCARVGRVGALHDQPAVRVQAAATKHIVRKTDQRYVRKPAARLGLSDVVVGNLLNGFGEVRRHADGQNRRVDLALVRLVGGLERDGDPGSGNLKAKCNHTLRTKIAES